MQPDALSPLYDFWYVGCLASDLQPGELKPISLLGEPIVLARGADGNAFALRNICPHRGYPLHLGWMEENSVRCAYHGWRFKAGGSCTEIPSLASGSTIDVGKMGCGAFPCIERHGLIWVYVTKGGKKPAEAPGAPPDIPGFGPDKSPDIFFSVTFPCDAFNAAYGLMDPTHGIFVHHSPWWNPKAWLKGGRVTPMLTEKGKAFEPAELGWKMTRHRVPQNRMGYRILGKQVSTELNYRLPGYRTEVIESEKYKVTSITAITPVNDNETLIHQMLYWDIPWAFLIKPLIAHAARTFVEQDRIVAAAQQEGLKHTPQLLLIDDADTQAKWWARLVAECHASRAENRPFNNPVQKRTLRWKS